MNKNWVRFGLIALLTVIFLFFFFRSVDWAEVARYLRGVDFSLFVLSLVLAPLHLVTRSLRWDYLIRHEKPGVPFASFFAANTVGFTVNFIFPGRVGELVRALFLAQKERIRKGFCLGTIVVERTFDTFTMCFFLGVFLLARPLFSSRFQAGVEGYASLRLWGIVGLALSVLLLTIILSLYFLREKTLSFITRLLKPVSEKISRKILALSEEFICGLKFFHSLKVLLMYALFSAVVWLGIIFFYWIFFLAFGIRLSYFLLVPYIFLTMVGASIPTPGMVGGFHYFSRLGMTSLYGIDPNLAVGVTILVHAIQLVVTSLIGYAILWKEGMSLFQLKRLGEKAES
ncbi:MAG: lysylphosphatidylglycerol synthase transmembrane domain-containing protein [Candidatus Aminicenantales bacterium]